MHWGTMMNTADTDKRDDDALEALFQQARSAPPEVPDGLLARVIADAEAARPPRGSGIWRTLWQSIGGPAGLGGLVTATLVGVWIGVAPPERLPDIAAGLIDGEYLSADSTTDVLQDDLSEGLAFGWDIEEG